jgi:hypothetical protein
MKRFPLPSLAFLLLALPVGISVSAAPVPLAPPAGLSVEAKSDAFRKGFDFVFRSDTSSTATISIDPLGSRHVASTSISSKAGSITLNGTYDRNDRMIVIVARRGGKEIGEFSWRVEASLR